MLYILTNTEKQSAWQEPFETLYMRELAALDYPFEVIARADLSKVTNKDFLWVMHYKDLALVRGTKGIVISQSNGTSANPYVFQVDPNIEAVEMEKIIDISLVFNTRQRVAMQSRFPKPVYLETGFPVEVPLDYQLAVKKPKTIVVPGRITPDKQFYLTTYLLEPLLEQGYDITFCLPKDNSYQYWLDFYHQENFTRLGFNFEAMSQAEYLAKASDSEFFFTASLGDICSISLAEALLCGCYPIVPLFGKGLPTYDAYLSTGYKPFSQEDVLNIFKLKPDIASTLTAFRPEVCTLKLTQGLQAYINEFIIL